MKFTLLFCLFFQTLAFGSDALISDAINKQLSFDYFMENSTPAQREIMRTSGKREPLESFMDIDESLIDSSELSANGVVFCKISFKFNALRGQPQNVFRMRVVAPDEQTGRQMIKDECDRFAEIHLRQRSNADWMCLNIQNKTTSCLDPENLTRRSVSQWNLTP
jgi:hypothetical protein